MFVSVVDLIEAGSQKRGRRQTSDTHRPRLTPPTLPPSPQQHSHTPTTTNPSPLHNTVSSLCRGFKALLLAAARPRQGVAPLMAAARKLQPREGVLTPAHAECLPL